jgi:hypothetical protein
MSRQQAFCAIRSAICLRISTTKLQTVRRSKAEVIKLGLDLHARQVTECCPLDGSTPKPAQQWDPWKLLDKVEEWVKAGSKVYSCYEAGPCGYWYHRELTKRGAVNYVVAPRLLETPFSVANQNRFRFLPSYPTTRHSIPLEGELFRTTKPRGLGLAKLSTLAPI